MSENVCDLIQQVESLQEQFDRMFEEYKVHFQKEKLLDQKLKKIKYEVDTALEYYTLENYKATHAPVPTVHLDFEKIKEILEE